LSDRRVGTSRDPLGLGLESLKLPVVQKGAKKMEKMWKAMKQAVPGAQPILDVFSGFSIMETVMSAFQPLLDVVSSLFEVLAAQILPAIMPALRPIMDILIQLTPVFVVIGKVIGLLLQVGLIPLQIIFQLLAAILVPLMPLLQPVIDFLTALSPALSVLATIIAGAILGVIRAVGIGIVIFINAIIITINTIMEILTLGFWDSIATFPLPSFDTGGRMLQRGIAQMDANEIAVTGNQIGELTSAMEEMRDETRLIRENKEFNKRVEMMRTGG